MYTKRHFEQQAHFIANMNLNTEQRKEIAEQYADMFEEDNERFDRERFMKACNLD